MTFEKLNYYVKLGDIASQILDIIEKSKKGEKVMTLGLPSSFTPDDLLEFQFNRMRILEVATRCNEEQITNWIHDIKRRNTRSEEDKFRDEAEANLLECGL